MRDLENCLRVLIPARYFRSRTFGNHPFQTKFESISGMDQRMKKSVKHTGQHFGLSICISSFLEVVLLRKDKLFESACSTLFRDFLGKEGDIALIETCACAQ